MRYIHIIIASLALISLSACGIDSLDCPTPDYDQSDEITIIGRTTRFDDYNVETRAAKVADEVKITSYAVAIFEVNGTGDTKTVGDCKFFKYDSNASQILLTISRHDEDNILLYTEDAQYAIYVFANMPGMGNFSEANTLEQMLKASFAVENLDIPTNGFPMIGSLGDQFSTRIDMDGKAFVMYSSEDENPPLVDGEPISTLNIPMRALFAKINFEIEVRPDQTIQGSDYQPQFKLTSYTVKDIPTSVDFDKTINASSFFDKEITSITGNRTASGADKINFTFYLPEHLLTPATSWEKYTYPFGTGDSIRDEDLKYRQRYKGKLLGEGQKATNIVISGEFRDHQSHSVEVDYTIHLGEDNFSDFNIKRNGEYNNYITIRGVLNSKDGNNENYISIDHRVNVHYTEPAIISLRREVLLDSHFEIRPLRIRKNATLDGDDLPTHVQVEVVNPSTTNWMRLERSFGDGIVDGVYPKNGNNEFIYIDNDPNNPSAIGKRRYFTYDLVDTTLAQSGQKVVVPLNPAENEDQCVWIYVDECTTIGDDIRTGTIRVTYGDLNGSVFEQTINTDEYPPVDYIINQRLLYPVKYEGNTYNIEFYEEYLYNFDSDDSYGQTDQSGMKWGLDGIQLSHLYDAIYLNSVGGDGNVFDNMAGVSIETIVQLANAGLNAAGIDPKYDFYLSRDTDNTNLEIRDFKGWEFNKEIIALLKTDEYKNDVKAKLERISLGENPESAIAYCYNRNKRDEDGNVIISNDRGWYLPAIDEIEEIVKAEYASYFKEFQDNLYWSCQPAYVPNYMFITRYNFIIWVWGDFDDNDGEFEGLYYVDDIQNARATKVLVNNGEYGGIPDSGADEYLSYPNGIFYYSNSPSSGSKNKTLEIGSSTVVNNDYNNIERHPGNRPRTDKARVRCVRKMN